MRRVLGATLVVVVLSCGGGDATPPGAGPAPPGSADAGAQDDGGLTQETGATADAGTCASEPFRARGLGFWAIQQDPTLRAWLVAQGSDRLSSITPTGATRSNALWETHSADGKGVIPELAIEAQRGGLALVAGGLASVVDHPGDTTYTGAGSMLDVGLKAIEWALAQRSKTSTAGIPCNDTNNPDSPPTATPDSWPCERGGAKDGGHSLHPKSELIHAAASALQMIVDAGTKVLPQSYLDRVDGAQGARSQLAAVGRWLTAQGSASGDVVKFRKVITLGAGYDPTHANFNQMLFVPTALSQVGALVGDPAAVLAAQDWMESPTYGVLKEEHVVAGSSPPQSVLPENAFVGLDGFDASYQGVSIELLVDYIGDLPPDSAFRNERLLPTLDRAYRRFDAALVVPPGGALQVDGAHVHNTRTCECGPRAAGAGEPDIPIRMLKYGLLQGKLCTDGIAARAAAIRAVGQTLEHFQDCSSAAGPAGDLCVSPH